MFPNGLDSRVPRFHGDGNDKAPQNANIWLSPELNTAFWTTLNVLVQTFSLNLFFGILREITTHRDAVSSYFSRGKKWRVLRYFYGKKLVLPFSPSSTI